MRKIINFIMLLLYRLKIFKMVTTLDRIKYISLCNISLYEKPYCSADIYVQEKDIHAYLTELKNINAFDLESGYYNYKPISTDRVIKMPLFQWCSHDNKIIPNEKTIFKEFLLEAAIFIANNIKGSKNTNNHYAFSNSHKLKPYIINIDYIVKYIVELNLQEV